jgi:cytochrome b561
VIRIVWRLTHPAPALPAGVAAWERILAHASHVLFYLLMLALPLTGWLLVSAETDPIQFWGLPWPHLPGAQAVFATRATRHVLQHIHTQYLVWIILANLALHVAGALKHQLDGHPVIWRMMPGPRRTR